jgi:type I restriction enzyme M protein
MQAWQQAVVEKGGEGFDMTPYASVSALLVEKSRIAENGEYNLTGERYKNFVKREKNLFPNVELKEVCEIISGQSPEGQFYNEEGIGTPFYQGKTEFSDIYIKAPVKWTTQVTKKAIKNDILMSVRAPVGPVNIATQEICIGRGLAAIRAEEDKVMHKYIFYLLRAKEKEINGNSGAVFPSINRSEIEKIKIPLPPLEVQREIVAEIEGYQRIIDGARMVVENWKPNIELELEEARKESGVEEWEMVKLGDVATLQYGYTASAKDEGEVRFIRITDISENGTLLQLSPKYIDISEENKKYLVNPDDLLVARTGATYGKTLIYHSVERAIFASYLIRIKFDKNTFIPKYYWYFAKSRNYWKQANNLVSGGGQPQFNGNAVSQIELEMPPIEIQKKIVEKFENERKLVGKNQNLIEMFERKISKLLNNFWGE